MTVELTDTVPAPSNVRDAAYPCIHSDLRVTFRFVAPTATSVQVAGGDGLGPGPFDMVRDDEGVWQVTTPPVVPGFHYYWLLVDGVAVNDPASQTYFGYGKPTSGVEVPEPGMDFYDQMLDDLAITYGYFESVDTAHEWQTWRRSLRAFAPLLFQCDR